MKASNEETRVNTSEVDAIGGAKPEPEERPVESRFSVEGGAPAHGGQAQSPALKLQQLPTVALETNVGELLQNFGKICRDCKHWNWRRGQAEMEHRAFAGTPEDRRLITNTFTELELQGDQGGGGGVPIIDSPEGIFSPTHAENVMATNGCCERLTEHFKDVVWIFPDAHCPASEIPELGKNLWEPRTTELGRRVQAMRDELMQTADVK